MKKILLLGGFCLLFFVFVGCGEDKSKYEYIGRLKTIYNTYGERADSFFIELEDGRKVKGRVGGNYFMAVEGDYVYRDDGWFYFFSYRIEKGDR